MVVDSPPRQGELPLDPAGADRVFHALADPTRRDIVMTTMRGEHSVSALARRYPMSFAAVQKHVAVLERARLVTKERRGREQIVRGNVETVRQAACLLDRLEELWRGRVDRIADLLDEPATTATAAATTTTPTPEGDPVP